MCWMTKFPLVESVAEKPIKVYKVAWNNFEGEINLIADVALPTEKLESAADKNMTENELEDLFAHQTNYISVLNKTLSILKEKHQSIKPMSKLPVIVPQKKKKSKGEAAG